MRLSFNLDDIKYLRMEYKQDDTIKSLKLALKEKQENEFYALCPKMDVLGIELPQKVSIDFICHDGLYKTTAVLVDIKEDEDHTCFVVQNPATLDYQQNRENYRILAEYDCIYTVDTEDGIESFNATTYDISAGGVSIIVDQNIISMDEMSILIFMPEHDLKSHLKFIRSEIYEKAYKLSFEFTDLSERDTKILSELCVNKQLS